MTKTKQFFTALEQKAIQKRNDLMFTLANQQGVSEFFAVAIVALVVVVVGAVLYLLFKDEIPGIFESVFEKMKEILNQFNITPGA